MTIIIIIVIKINYYNYEDLISLENVVCMYNILGSELWESKFDGCFAWLKE